MLIEIKKQKKRTILNTSKYFEQEDQQKEKEEGKEEGEEEENIREEIETEENSLKKLQIERNLLKEKNYKENGLFLLENNNIQEALLVWKRGVRYDIDNYLVHDLISQAYLNLDQLLPAIKSAEEVIRIAPGWADGYVTLARAQREFGEPELAYNNYKIAQSIILKRTNLLLNSNNTNNLTILNQEEDIQEDYPSYPSDSTFEEIQIELIELEDFIQKLNIKRQEYVTNQSYNKNQDQCNICNNSDNEQLQKCLHNLCGRVKVLKIEE